MHEHRCPRCRALHARSTVDGLEIRRSDFKAKLTGQFRLEFRCYRCDAAFRVDSTEAGGSSPAPRG